MKHTRAGKRLLSVVLSLVIVLSLFSAASVSASAEVIAEGELTEKVRWTFDSDGTLTISGEGDMPAADYDAACFYGITALEKSSIKAVVIEDGVTSVGTCAFRNCGQMRQADVADSVVSIGDLAFASCEFLTKFTVPSGVTEIDTRTFYGCTSLTQVSIPDGVFNIEDAAFGRCHNLTDIKLPENLRILGAGVFYQCYSLTDITIPEKVYYMESQQFLECYHLKSIELSDSIKYIYPETFAECRELESITLPYLVDGIGDAAFRNCLSLTEVTLSDKIIDIKQNAFSGCVKLREISLPDTAENIGETAFKDCAALTEITIPRNVAAMGKDTFKGDTAIAEVYCYADPNALTWEENGDDFMANKATVCHVMPKYLENYKSAFSDVNVTYIGELVDEKIDSVPATCKTDGNIEYYKDADGSFYVYDGSVYTEIDEPDIMIHAPGHAWGEVDYSRSGDNRICVATRVCATDNTHIETEKATVASEITKAPTCREKGITTYTANFKNSGFKTQTKEIENVDVTTHKWGEPVWTWNGVEGATAVFTCEYGCGNSESVTAASITADNIYAAHCENDAEVHYRAEVTFDSGTYSDEKTLTLHATGHSWGQPEWKWSGHDAASAVFTCSSCAQELTLDAQITEVIETEPTYDSEGLGTYTAKVSFEGVEYTDTRTDILPKLTPPVIEIGLLGDMNGDGVVDSADALALLRASVDPEPLDENKRLLGDAQGDGTVDSSDALEVLRFSVLLPANENIGKPVTVTAEA